jgi:hypothetical protein
MSQLCWCCEDEEDIVRNLGCTFDLKNTECHGRVDIIPLMWEIRGFNLGPQTTITEFSWFTSFPSFNCRLLPST